MVLKRILLPFMGFFRSPSPCLFPSRLLFITARRIFYRIFGLYYDIKIKRKNDTEIDEVHPFMLDDANTITY